MVEVKDGMHFILHCEDLSEEEVIEFYEFGGWMAMRRGKIG